MDQIDESKIRTFFALLFVFAVIIVILSNTKYDFYSAEELYSKGVELYKSGKYFEAIQKMNEIIEKIPSYQKAYILKGKAYTKLYLEHRSRNFSGAYRGEDFLALAKFNFDIANKIKDNAVAHYYLGLIYYWINDIQKSIFHASKSFALDPKMEESQKLLVNLLKIYVQRIQSEKAMRRIREKTENLIFSDESEYSEEHEDYLLLYDGFDKTILDDDDDDGDDDDEIEKDEWNYELNTFDE
ncbi:hypothetical protein HRbin19_01350 [bacterium HR19]|nr:hypothetical protein HRbin19_01350 [bacterium HR19]